MTESTLTGKRILVTGGNGFLGRYVVDRLNALEAKVTIASHAHTDLRYAEPVIQMLGSVQPDIVIHLAAHVGGIGANIEAPAEMFYDNAMMGLNILHQSWMSGVRKLVMIGTACSYPRDEYVPVREESIWNGYPEPTNAYYGIAKRMLLAGCQSYRKQYGFNAIYLVPTNLYGPWDNFDPENSHVIPAIITKVNEAKRHDNKGVVLWGDGSPTRDFLYVDECARGIVMATENYNKPDPVNLSSNSEISISRLANLIKSEIGYNGQIVWDKTKPNGQPRRKLSSHKAVYEFGFQDEMPFNQGLRNTVRWYLDMEDASQ